MNRYISLCNDTCRSSFTRSVSRTVARMHGFLAEGKRVSWLLRKQTKERNEGTGALGGPAPLFMGHCICWPRITLQRRPVWSHLTSDFTFDSLLANGSCISIRWPALSRYYEPYSIRCYAFSTAIIDPRSFPLFDSFANWRRAG